MNWRNSTDSKCGQTLLALLVAGCITLASGCRGYQIGHILKPNDKDMVGSHSAGASTFNPLVDEAVHKLLHAAEANEVGVANDQGIPASVNICFVGIENRSSEELGDFKEQLFEKSTRRLTIIRYSIRSVETTSTPGCV